MCFACGSVGSSTELFPGIFAQVKAEQMWFSHLRDTGEHAHEHAHEAMPMTQVADNVCSEFQKESGLQQSDGLMKAQESKLKSNAISSQMSSLAMMLEWF